MTFTRRLGGLGAYARKARQLSAHWAVPLPLTLYRLAMARLLFNRGYEQFDLYQFTTRAVREWRAYITPEEILALQLPFAPESARSLDEDKVRFAEHCAAHGLPTVPLTAIVSRAPATGTHDAHLAAIHSAHELESLFRSLGDFRGFAKPRGGGGGYGAFSFAIRGGELVPRAGARSVQEMFDTCASGRFAEQGYVLQSHVDAHEALHPFMPGPGLGTIRVCTFLMPDGELCVPYAVLKVPSPGSDSDNAHWGSLLAQVDPQSGELSAAVGRLSRGGVTQTVERHPETGALFKGAIVPEWPSVRDLVARAAHAFSALPALGWDVAITPAGPLLLEANWQFGGRMPEVSAGRGWADEYRALFSRLGRRGAAEGDEPVPLAPSRAAGRASAA